jgi:hypothetical protein
MTRLSWRDRGGDTSRKQSADKGLTLEILRSKVIATIELNANIPNQLRSLVAIY